MESNTSFIGTGWDFPPRFIKEKKGVVMTQDDEDIQKSLSLLLSTQKGERLMQPGYGSNLNKLLFGALSNTEESLVIEMLRLAILHYEPRIVLHNILLDKSNLEEGILNIELEYTIRTTNSRANMVYPFYINEGTIISGK